MKRNEITALNIIKQLQIVDISHFQKGECPDWQNNEDDIGLEITDSRTPEQGEIDSIMQYNFKNNIPLDEVIANDKKGKLKDELITVDNSYAKFRMLTNPSLESYIDTKIKKLNKHFNKFSQNWLFIFVDFIFDFNYIKLNQGSIISKLHDKYKIGFNKYILFNLNEIIVLDFEKNNLINAGIYKYINN